MHPGRSFVFVLVAACLALAVVLPAAAQDDLDLYGRKRLGDPAESPPYIIALHTTLDTERIREQELPRFVFELTWRANDTGVIPGPPLQLFVYACAPDPDGPEGSCALQMQERTEVGYVIRDAEDGTLDGRYPWAPEEGDVFDDANEWIVEVGLADRAVNSTARFRFETTDLPVVPGALVDIFNLLFGREGNAVARVGVMVLWLGIFFLVGRGLARLGRRTVLSPSRVDPTVGKLATRLAAALWTIIAIAWALWVVWRVNFWAGLTALGLLSVALGFGMQNTVANLMGGLNLASDKPFVVGDRIMVGESWGDVQEIGLRSTKILTTRKEVVIIPNKLLDEREIWNYTRDHQELRLDIDVGISYDSDWKLAEALMIQAARENPAILDYPRPRVLMQDFADSQVALQLRCWLQAAKDARIVSSELRKAIKDKFDEGGVEIPFPYRTLVEKKDLKAPRRADPDELKKYAAQETSLPRMLYATAGPPQIHAIADFVGKIAKELDVALTVLYVTKPGARISRAETYRVFSAFQDAAAHHTVPLKTLHRRGPVIETIKEVIKHEAIDLVSIGAHRQAILTSPRHVADLTKEIRQSVDLPVLIVPRALEISTRTLTHYRNLLEERHVVKERKKSGIVSDKTVKPSTRRAEALGSGLRPRDSGRATAGRAGTRSQVVPEPTDDDEDGFPDTFEEEEEENGATRADDRDPDGEATDGEMDADEEDDEEEEEGREGDDDGAGAPPR